MVEARRYSSSTSGWSELSSMTRAMTRRWSVMRMPRATQASSRVGSDGTLLKPILRADGSERGLAKIARHDKRGRRRAVGAGIIALSRRHGGKSQPLVKGDGGQVLLVDLKEHLSRRRQHEIGKDRLE